MGRGPGGCHLRETRTSLQDEWDGSYVKLKRDKIRYTGVVNLEYFRFIELCLATHQYKTNLLTPRSSPPRPFHPQMAAFVSSSPGISAN